jgi:threonylcarbamoyladenosine tRNA methylthiotransferase MtaB
VADGSAERRALALVTHGCRAARADADLLAEALSATCRPAAPGERAALVVVSTCAVTADADAAARQAVRRAARDHPGARLVVVGCAAELSREAMRALPGVSAVLGVRPSADAVLGAGGRRGSPPGDPLSADRAAPALAEARRARPLVKVQDGCDERCSYCVVPRARGRSSSVPPAEALARVGALAHDHAEIVLTGVHLGAYGKDLLPEGSLALLVREIARSFPALRVRLSSVEPLELGRAIPDDDADARVLCPHFHLPLQSGADRVLAAMGRPYASAAYAVAVHEAARRFPGACLGADVITGFPGETEADHAATVALVERLPLAYLHVFPFSARAGTVAAGLPGQVPPAVARARAAALRALSERRWRGFLDALVGRTLEVVVERVRGGIAQGTSREYAPVSFPAGEARRGGLARVAIARRDGAGLAGVLA